MLKFYLVVEKGLAGELVYHLQTRLTIGRAPESDIYLPDPSVSRLHALAYKDLSLLKSASSNIMRSTLLSEEEKIISEGGNRW